MENNGQKEQQQQQGGEQAEMHSEFLSRLNTIPIICMTLGFARDLIKSATVSTHQLFQHSLYKFSSVHKCCWKIRTYFFLHLLLALITLLLSLFDIELDQPFWLPSIHSFGQQEDVQESSWKSSRLIFHLSPLHFSISHVPTLSFMCLSFLDYSSSSSSW